MRRMIFMVLVLVLLLPGCRWGTASLSIAHFDQAGNEYRLAWTTEEVKHDYLR